MRKISYCFRRGELRRKISYDEENLLLFQEREIEEKNQLLFQEREISCCFRKQEIGSCFGKQGVILGSCCFRKQSVVGCFRRGKLKRKISYCFKKQSDVLVRSSCWRQIIVCGFSYSGGQQFVALVMVVDSSLWLQFCLSHDPQMTSQYNFNDQRCYLRHSYDFD